MKKDYMTRLECAARWRLPPQEAEDVIADYRDIVSNPPRTEEELRREVGDPEQVIRLLVSPPRAYRIWQAVFIALSACILIPGVSPHAFFYMIWDKCFGGPYGGGWGSFDFSHWGPILAGVGLVGSLVWFRWKGQKEGQLDKPLLVLLAVLAAWCGALLLVDWLALRAPVEFSAMWGEIPLTYLGIPIGPNGGSMVSRSIQYLKAFQQDGGTIAAFIGVFALVKARTEDRRWTAVYALSMAVMLISMESLALWAAIDPSFGFPAGWYYARLGYYAAIFVVGLLGAGVALC